MTDIRETILAKVLGWKGNIGDEYYDLQALGNSGYDDYMQFRPGMRFVASLAMWLKRFPLEKRAAAYEFVKKHVLFITRAQMEQLVSVAYPDYVIPVLAKQIAGDESNSLRRWDVSKTLRSKEFDMLHKRCLFMGMSDGSHIDEFRRSSSKIDHEQVTRTHEINKARADKLHKKLEERTKPSGQKAYFQNVFLLDDFSATGTSYISEDGQSGKIAAFHKSITSTEDPLHGLVDLEDLKVHVILYVATERAVATILDNGRKLFAPIQFSVTAIHTIPDSVKFDESANPEFAKLVLDERFGYKDIFDEHMTAENSPQPWLGFGSCGLPLVLYHNTPNNSLPILYRNDDRTEFKGLFPRVRRHQ